MKRDTFVGLFVCTLLVGLSVAGRLMPHPPNFTPFAAAALFAGFFFSSRWAALSIPIAAMALSDAFIGSYDPRVMLVVYASIAFPVLLRSFLATRLNLVRLGLCAITSSVVFFITTNLAVWACTPMYTRDLSGIATCYAAALPFFKYTLAGDMLWSAVFFGTYALAVFLRKSTQVEPSIGQPVAATIPTSS